MAIPNEKEKYSYADYLTWEEGERVEIIDGDIISMSPAPSRRHQEILGELFIALSVCLRDKACKAFIAPFDVRLLAEDKRDDEVDQVVQPDLSIVCDQHKLDDKGCNGAPDIIVEVLSPSTVKLDRWTKYLLYEKAGVKEYWLVDPANKSVEIHRLVAGLYKFQGVFTKEDTIDVELLSGLKLDLEPIFA
ncbi:Uma2 family endonuclease [Shouchella shacheensis]|uniref:Uma2 family endonuclease n=1 Tax=Shouchella shacheensis TaxID=1649580 RepID=UPI0007401738|nr:Uma2 family endonuclease [Shouchella shacheensis]